MLPGRAVSRRAAFSCPCMLTQYREVAMTSYVGRRPARSGRVLSVFATSVLVASVLLLQSCNKNVEPSVDSAQESEGKGSSAQALRLPRPRPRFHLLEAS